VVAVIEELERGREAYAGRSWRDAFESLSSADRARPLDAADLELLARAAYMLGRDGEYAAALERAHVAHLGAGDVPRAVRCAFWIGHSLLFRGEPARAGGWFGRAQRLLEDDGRDCVERGYLLMPVVLEQIGRGDYGAGAQTAARAAEIGGRFGDADLRWLSVDEQGRALVKQGRVEEGLRLVDEVLVVVAAGELSPVVAGIVYCNTIAFCRDAHELRHAREWTQALTRWCERQPQMVAHNGLCLVHRAEIMQLQGAWPAALDEARGAAERFTEGALNRLAAGRAHYRQGELHRLRGEQAAAERAYREASRRGCEPQPGLALLRLAQGRHDAAFAAMRRAAAETLEPLRRASLLPAYVEVALAAGDVDAARSACRELEGIAQRGSEALAAMSALARGALALALGDARAALVASRRAWRAWEELEAPYEAARARVLVGVSCRSLGDQEACSLELEAARETFAALGAAPDLARVDALAGRGRRGGAHGLTPRELQVLRRVAAGDTNRDIAAALSISEHTVARHVQNIFAKLGVSSRTAASAFAFEHDLASPA